MQLTLLSRREGLMVLVAQWLPLSSLSAQFSSSSHGTRTAEQLSGASQTYRRLGLETQETRHAVRRG